MGSFKAAMQAVVPHLAIAPAVARLLMQNARNLRRHLVHGHLVRMREVGPCKLISAHNRRKWLRRSRRVIGWHIFRRVRPLGRGNYRKQTESKTANPTLHSCNYKLFAEVPEKQEVKKKDGMNGTLFMPGGQ